MLPYLDVKLFVKQTDGQKSLVAIKRKDDLLWCYFEKKHWPLDKHPLYMQSRIDILKVKRSNSRVSFRLIKENVQHYYDEAEQRFRYDGKWLECTGNREFVKRREPKKPTGEREVSKKRPALKLKKQTFKEGIDNPRLWIEQVFENCFAKKDSNQMKFQLNRFIPRADKPHFANDLLMTDYEVVKQKFVNRYLHTHLAAKKKALQIQKNEYPTLRGFISQLVLNLKKFCPHLADESILCEELLCRLDPNLAAMFYLSNNHTSLDNILNYAEILDNNRQAISASAQPQTEAIDPAMYRMAPSTTSLPNTEASNVSSGSSRKRGPTAAPRKNLNKATKK